MDSTKLKLIANELRKKIILSLENAKSGHTGGALGLADLFAVLYFEVANISKENILKPSRDYIFLSNGHTCPVLYATLAQKGIITDKELMTLRKLGSRLQGHPHVGVLPGVENSGGPLGQGISQAVGCAVALKRDQKKNKVFCFVGDGELEEGQCWEAMLFASKEQCDNLIVIVDRNNMQIDGTVQEVAHLFPLGKKFAAFGFHVIHLDGNNIFQIRQAFEYAQTIGKPVVLIARTIPGKGVSFMEGDYHWHGKVPTADEAKKAISELEKIDIQLLGGEK